MNVNIKLDFLWFLEVDHQQSLVGYSRVEKGCTDFDHDSEIMDMKLENKLFAGRDHMS